MFAKILTEAFSDRGIDVLVIELAPDRLEVMGDELSQVELAVALCDSIGVGVTRGNESYNFYLENLC